MIDAEKTIYIIVIPAETGTTVNYNGSASPKNASTPPSAEYPSAAIPTTTKSPMSVKPFNLHIILALFFKENLSIPSVDCNGNDWTSLEKLGTLQSRVAASNAAWGWQCSKSSVTIPMTAKIHGDTTEGSCSQIETFVILWVYPGS
jgi:hypothetical protein